MLQLAQRNLQDRTGVINFRAAEIHPRPGHATVHHHWGIRPLRLEIAPRKTLYEELHPYGSSAAGRCTARVGGRWWAAMGDATLRHGA